MDDRLVEYVARGLASVDGCDPDQLCGVPSCPVRWMLFEDDAKAAIEVMTSYNETQGIIEELVFVHGDFHRKVIESAIWFLYEQEPKWGLISSIDKKTYVADIINNLYR